MDEPFYFNDCKEESLINITRDNNYVYLHVMKDFQDYYKATCNKYI